MYLIWLFQDQKMKTGRHEGELDAEKDSIYQHFVMTAAAVHVLLSALRGFLCVTVIFILPRLGDTVTVQIRTQCLNSYRKKIEGIQPSGDRGIFCYFFNIFFCSRPPCKICVAGR